MTMTTGRTRYRFLHRGSDDRYHWESVTRLRGDSRVEQISCDVCRFWTGMMK